MDFHAVAVVVSGAGAGSVETAGREGFGGW